ncbi:MAG: TIGR04283 family arsenosugar biosynthesis glycosyltransferase [Fuerstiella sp.]|nr:TIGR04283 family arsenosugar biosynthesis glycosyltransferase [Fuerstiella sp.]
MKISVIIPAIDEVQVIGAAVDSAVCAGADEVILADGGSQDGTPAVAESHGASVMSAEQGRAHQQNAGAQSAAGDVLLFLHADCCLPKSGLSEIRGRLSKEKSCVGGYFRQHIDGSPLVYRWIETGNLLRAGMLKWAYGDQAIFVRTDIFRDIGGFPEIPLMEDLYMMKKLKQRGNLICIDSPLLVSARRWENRGVLRQTLRNWLLLAAAHLGVSPSVLSRFYPRTTSSKCCGAALLTIAPLLSGSAI